MMHAMILAAGRGERMRPLTDTVPKPLLRAAGKPLLQYHLEALARAGFGDIVINHGPQGGRIEAAFGSGERFGVRIRYSAEGETPLDTGGGIRHALPLLGAAPFLVVNADVNTDFDFATLPREPAGLAHLVLVDNPSHHREGDFALHGDRVRTAGPVRYTYAGIAVFRPEMLRNLAERVFPLAPVLRSMATADQVSGEIYRGRWIDVGTPARLEALNIELGGRRS
jgi:MurNAc alpha-1-phosphate uridylyltransferase